MALTLDHMLFGDGHGMGSPLIDNRFYWLVDTSQSERNGRHGRLYTYMPGLGCQLHSYEWTSPRAGTRRRLNGREYVVLHTRRKWLRVEVAWLLARMPENLDEALAEMRAIKTELDAM